jgi:uncharacterized protein (DUF58 family)
MQWLTKTTITKTYLMAILVVGMTFSPIPEFLLAIALLVVNLYSTYKQVPLNINIAMLFGTIILAPLTLTPLFGSILSSILVLPAIYLLDQNLKEYALTLLLKPKKRAREPTPLLKSALIALGVILATSITLVNPTLISAAAVLFAYFAFIVGVAVRRVPKNPIQNTKTWSRLLVGNTEKKTIQLSSATKQSLYFTVTPLQKWVRVKQSSYILKSDKNADIEVTFTPPLAGPTKIQLAGSTLDVRGLIQNTQLIETIELHVLPRAKYAEWLAKKFLEHSGVGASATAATSQLKAAKLARKSVEYYGNRPYQPGDRLREIDWKHTYMLGELVAKDFEGTHKQPTIIAANFDTDSAEKADRLAYNVIVSALTSAIEALPSGTAFFNHDAVISAAGPADSRETIKKALKYTGLIKVRPQPMRILQPEIPVEIPASRQENSQIKELLEFEASINQKITKAYPGSQALNKCVEKTLTPSMIIVASSLTDEEKALLIALHKLEDKGHKIIKIGT